MFTTCHELKLDMYKKLKLVSLPVCSMYYQFGQKV